MDKTHNDDVLELLRNVRGDIAARESAKMCELAERNGKRLDAADVRRLYMAREEQLHENGRVEFGAGVLPKIVYALCDSPYIDPDDFAIAIERFTGIFYAFKNECEDELTDDELIQALGTYFNACEGDFEATTDAGFEDILRLRKE